MKIKINKGQTYLKFKGEVTKGQIYYDGSGYLEVKPKSYICQEGNYIREDAEHEDRVRDIKKLYFLNKKAYQELKKIKYLRKLHFR